MENACSFRKHRSPALTESSSPRRGFSRPRGWSKAPFTTACRAAAVDHRILAKRAKGVPATKLAEKYGVSTAYIYMIKE